LYPCRWWRRPRLAASRDNESQKKKNGAASRHAKTPVCGKVLRFQVSQNPKKIPGGVSPRTPPLGGDVGLEEQGYLCRITVRCPNFFFVLWVPFPNLVETNGGETSPKVAPYMGASFPNFSFPTGSTRTQSGRFLVKKDTLWGSLGVMPPYPLWATR